MRKHISDTLIFTLVMSLDPRGAFKDHGMLYFFKCLTNSFLMTN